MTHALPSAADDPLRQLRETIQKTILDWVNEHAGLNWWREPLVSTASAQDPLFEELKTLIDPGHALPTDLLPDARSVVVFFIPFQKSLGRENRKAGHFASHSWADAYGTTNRLIAAVNADLQKLIAEAGYEAALTPATHNFDEEKLISLWSHKHLGYIAGLGTFGHHCQLITASGSCGRLGSLVTSMPLPPTARPDQEWCLHKAGRRCLVCVSHCTYGALYQDHFDRQACYRQCLANDAHHQNLPLVDVCGKCACEVPCSYGIPKGL